MYPRDAHRIANDVDPNQITPRTVCQDLSVGILRNLRVLKFYFIKEYFVSLKTLWSLQNSVNIKLFGAMTQKSISTSDSVSNPTPKWAKIDPTDSGWTSSAWPSSDTQKNWCTYPKTEMVFCYPRVMGLKDVVGIAKSVDRSSRSRHCLSRPVCPKTTDHYRTPAIRSFGDQMNNFLKLQSYLKSFLINIVNFLNIRTPEEFVVITLKFELHIYVALP